MRSNVFYEICLGKVTERTAKTDLLILDDFGLKPLEGQELLNMMEIIKDRHGLKSTIIASQIPFAQWYEVMSESEFFKVLYPNIVNSRPLKSIQSSILQ